MAGDKINKLGASSRGMNRIEFLLFNASIGELNPLVGLKEYYLK